MKTQVFNKSTRDKLKGSFITHIKGDPIFSTKDAAMKLEQIYQEYLQQVQVVAGKNNKFSFLITFAP